MGMNNRRLIKNYRQHQGEIVNRFAKKLGIEIDSGNGLYSWHDYYFIGIEDVIIDLESNTSDTEYMKYIDFCAFTDIRCSYANWLKLGGYANRKYIFALLEKQREESLLASAESVKECEKLLLEEIERLNNEKREN